MNIIDQITTFYLKSPLILLFTVIGIGFLLGQVKVKGINLGVAAVLFVGLAIGSLHPDLKLPEIVYQMGLLFFIYTIGIANGESFFNSFKKHGVRDNIFTLSVLVVLFGLTIVLAKFLDLKSTYASGLFTGSFTNTPALAASIELIKSLSHQNFHLAVSSEPVIAYSIAYPMGVISMILVIVFLQFVWKKELKGVGSDKLKSDFDPESVLDNEVVFVNNKEVFGMAINEVLVKHNLNIIFSRIKSNNEMQMATTDIILQENDLVTIVGPIKEIKRAIEVLGVVSNVQLDQDHSQVEHRRVVVSNPKVIGFRLGELNLTKTLGVVVTRLRRGDVDFLPDDDTIIQSGDKLRLVSDHDHIAKASKFLGDSYKAISEIDIFPFSLGMALGLLIGQIPIPIGKDISISLGIAGGPLIVALLLGYFGRTGPIVWSIPYNANLTIRQIGIILFLAGVGTRSGYIFKDTLANQSIGFTLFVGGIILTTTGALLFLFVGHKFLKIPFTKLMGMLAGFQTQPAVLGFAMEQAQNERPNVGYASVFPMATIAKIILAQLLVILL